MSRFDNDGSSRMRNAGVKAVEAWVRLQDSAKRIVDDVFGDDEPTKPGEAGLTDSGVRSRRAATNA